MRGVLPAAAGVCMRVPRAARDEGAEAVMHVGEVLLGGGGVGTCTAARPGAGDALFAYAETPAGGHGIVRRFSRGRGSTDGAAAPPGRGGAGAAATSLAPPEAVAGFCSHLLRPGSGAGAASSGGFFQDRAAPSAGGAGAQGGGCAADGCGHATATGTKQCSRCKQVRYCSVACQRSHWKQHKAQCSQAGAT